MQIGDHLHGMSNPTLEEKYDKYFKMPSAETFTQHAKHLNAGCHCLIPIG